jgi:hypothetical protein
VRRVLYALVTLATIGGTLAGCSSQQAMTPAARSELQAGVNAVRQAADQRQARAAHAALVKLRTEVLQLEASQQITTEAGANVLSAASQVQANLDLITTTTTSTTTTTTTSTTTTFPPEHKGDGKDHNGQSNGGGG